MTVLNMYHEGQHQPWGSINIMRGSIFGNPFRIGIHGGRDAVVDKCEAYLRKRVEIDPVFAEEVRQLFGKDLYCCCAPERCHGDVLEEIAGELQEQWEDEQIKLQAERVEQELADLEGLFGPIQE